MKNWRVTLCALACAALTMTSVLATAQERAKTSQSTERQKKQLMDGIAVAVHEYQKSRSESPPKQSKSLSRLRTVLTEASSSGLPLNIDPSQLSEAQLKTRIDTMLNREASIATRGMNPIDVISICIDLVKISCGILYPQVELPTHPAVEILSPVQEEYDLEDLASPNK